MTVQLGQIAPDFEQDTLNGSIRFHEWVNRSWCILFSHPTGGAPDVSPACATALATAARLKPEWTRRGVKIVALSVNSSDSHASWERDILQTHGWTLNFPIIADADRMVSTLYGMVRPGAVASAIVRCVFVIDPDKKIRLMRTYPPATACDFEEMLRLVDRLQQGDAEPEAAAASERQSLGRLS